MTFFHYMHKDTVLHRMDARLKLPCMLLLSLSASLATEWWHYLAPLALTAAAFAVAKLPLTALLKDMRFFAIICLSVLAADAFAITGDPIPHCPVAGISVQGVLTGLRFAGRLILILMACTVMAGTTSLLDFKNAIEWYLRPIPFLPEVRVATMVNLTFTLIPVIFDSYAEMMDAQKSRCAQLRKNPIKRVYFIVFPLLGRTLRRADEIVYAMESRCYSEVRTRAVFQTNKADWMILAACVAVLALTLK